MYCMCMDLAIDLQYVDLFRFALIRHRIRMDSHGFSWIWYGLAWILHGFGCGFRIDFASIWHGFGMDSMYWVWICMDSVWI